MFSLLFPRSPLCTVAIVFYTFVCIPLERLKKQCGVAEPQHDDGYHLPGFMFGDKQKKNEEEEKICCSICLVDYEAEDAVTHLPRCNHLFHINCIEPWLLSGHLTCPLCRSFVFSPPTARINQEQQNTAVPTKMSPQPPQQIGLPWPELNDGLTYKDVVSSSDSELTTVSDFYYTKYKSSAPLLGWIQRIQNGQIQVDGEVVKDPNTLLRSGSKLVYHRLPWKEPDTPHLLDILYQDDDLIALNKPSGLQVLPGGLFQQRTVLTQLQWCFGESHPVPVHRLGRGTSGILLCAKTKLAKTKLSAYFAEGTSLVGSGNMGQECGTVRKISKIYRALASGIVEEDEARPLYYFAMIIFIKQPIGVVRYPGVAKGLYVASSEGKPSFSKVIVLERDRQRDCTLVKVEIQSGRPHQIRIHLAFIGHPLVGDPLYVAGGQPKGVDPDLVDAASTPSFAEDGGYRRPNQAVPGDCGYHLHAHEVEIPNLLNTRKVLKVVAPLPPILQTSYLVEEKGLPSCKLS
ncbi:hypothetical protein HID58_077649 [Brassica napus]|uniref:RING-type domain-containing protein n=2 Tax=Brassica napus TaxID=3708 RepID=A0ABQ7YSJ8_BRANA|nr:hypothetical protein HID58_077649 [Brassica napus]CDY29071.1 BnaC07g32770D [Brassica napus]